MAWGLINPLSPTIANQEQPVIFDGDGFVHSSWDYCITGENEGWLIRKGYHVGNHNVVYRHFVMIHAP